MDLASLYKDFRYGLITKEEFIKLKEELAGAGAGAGGVAVQAPVIQNFSGDMIQFTTTATTGVINNRQPRRPGA